MATATVNSNNVISSLVHCVIVPFEMSLTSQPGTSFMISLSRSSAAC